MNLRLPVAAITAAGASSRMGRPKALLPWNGKPLLEHMIAALRGAGLERIAVVTGAGRRQIEASALRLRVDVAHNANHAAGRFSSVQVAARWARGEPLLLWPVDCPAVAVRTLRALVEEARERPDASVVPRHGARCGHPVILPGSVVAAMAGAEAEGNLRQWVRAAPGGRVTVSVWDPAVLDNLNTPLDYRCFLETRPPATTVETEVDHG
ncbi:MAG: nucleotidyltransferase family protein [Acidobacteriota bacterium]|nr:nucleotidyltransferase family protein [Acidobacteriota bacterium]MDQ7088006.1 nucleotidyltransferase family protein [Acidobacteriota bacterium]